MEKKTAEQTQIQVTLKQAVQYIIAIVGMAAGLVLIYQKKVSNDEKSNDKIATMQIDIKTNATQIETLKSDINKLRLEFEILKAKMEH